MNFSYNFTQEVNAVMSFPKTHKDLKYGMPNIILCALQNYK